MRVFSRIADVVRRATGRSQADGRGQRTRVLVPTAGGPNAASVLDVLPGLGNAAHEVTFLRVRRPGAAPAPRSEGHEVVSDDVAGTIAAASREADLLVIGASSGERPIANATVIELVRTSACPAVVVRAGDPGARQRALVVGENSAVGLIALDRAMRCARLGRPRVQVLLGAASDRTDPHRRPLRIESAVTWTVVRRPLDAGVVLDALRGCDLLSVAVDPYELAPWLDEVVREAPCPVAIAFTRPSGSGTRRRAVELAVRS